MNNDIRKTNYDAVKEILGDYDWTGVFNSDFQTNYTCFLDKLFEIVHTHSPLKGPPKRKKNMYMTNEALRLKNRKNKMWKRYQATGGIYDRTSFVSAKNKLRNLTRKLRRDFETKIAQNGHHNIRCIFLVTFR